MHAKMRMVGYVLQRVGVAGDAFERSRELINSNVDVIVVDTAHGHSKGVLKAISKIKSLSPNKDVIAGNVASGDGTKALIDAGPTVLKWELDQEQVVPQE